MVTKLDTQIDEIEKKLKELKNKKTQELKKLKSKQNAELKKIDDVTKKHVGNFMMSLFEKHEKIDSELKEPLKIIKSKLMEHYNKNDAVTKTLEIYFSRFN